MNMYCSSVIHQIEMAILSVVKMIDQLEERDLEIRPTENKHSVGELLSHLAVICKADFLISIGTSKEDMSSFYETAVPKTLQNIKSELLNNFAFLKAEVMKLDEHELLTETTSYWGVTYTRYEWLLEILAHLYHHRGQLHAMLVHCCRKNLNVALFE